MDEVFNWIIFNEHFLEEHDSYTTYDFHESGYITDSQIDSLVKMMIDAKNDPEILADMAAYMSWDRISDYLKKRAPSQDNMKKGDFGEALINYILKNHFDYIIPVQKLRFKLSKDQSLPSTDSLALKLDGEDILEICYVESKTPTRYTTTEIKKAYEQLQGDYDKDIPDMIMFILEVVKNSNRCLYNILHKYLKSRELQKDKDRFVIGYTSEKMIWSCTSLKNLDEVIKEDYPPTLLNLFLIKNLEKKIGFIISKIGSRLID